MTKVEPGGPRPIMSSYTDVASTADTDKQIAVPGGAETVLPGEATRNNNIGPLRLVFATLVLFSHCFPLLRKDNATEWFYVLTRGQITGGQLAVDAFFVISGFLVTASWTRSANVWDYLWKRICRIYPGFAVASLVGAFLVVPLAAGSLKVPLRGVLYAIIQLQAVPATVFSRNPYAALNGSLWTIPIEFQCYLYVFLVASVAKLCRLKLNRVVVALFILCLAAYLYAWSRRLDLEATSIRFETFFAAGAVSYLFREKVVVTEWAARVCAALLLAAALSGYGLAALLPVCGTCALLYIALRPSRLARRIGAGNDYSYGIFLYAWPVQELIVMRGGASLTPLLLFCGAFPLTVFCAFLSWHLIEKPCLIMKAAIFRRTSAPVSPTRERV